MYVYNNYIEGIHCSFIKYMLHKFIKSLNTNEYTTQVFSTTQVNKQLGTNKLTHHDTIRAKKQQLRELTYQ